MKKEWGALLLPQPRPRVSGLTDNLTECVTDIIIDSLAAF